jgi:hypothetical protein
MYRILGADGRQYGPATAEQVRAWAAEGRVNGQTQALAEGAAQWKPLAEYVEFAPLFVRVAPALSAPGTISSTPTPQTNSLAITSMIMGLLSLTCGICCCHGLPFNVLGIVFSLIALSQIRNEPRYEQSRPIAIAGLVLSILSIVAAFFMMAFGLAMSAPDIMHRLHRL